MKAATEKKKKAGRTELYNRRQFGERTETNTWERFVFTSKVIELS